MRFMSLPKGTDLGLARIILSRRFLRCRLSVVLGLVFGLLVFVVPSFSHEVVAQQNPQSSMTPEVAAVTPVAEDTRYRIGAGDVLAVLVRKSPELTVEAVRVDQRGMIRLPMVDGEVRAACQTENELATRIATLYLEYKKQPSVEVFVRDFQSRPVAVIGAVNAPGQFRLQRQVRLLELLSFAGGPSERAGRVINVIHTGGPNICRNDTPEGEGSTVQGLGIYKLPDTVKGREGSNPFVQPGDIVSLPEADQVFVVGSVYQPRSIYLKDKPITVMRAIAMAGGTQRDSNTGRIRIVRQTADGAPKQEIFVNLKAIESHKAEDIVLLPNDIVAVPTSAGKVLLNALTGAIAPAITNGSIRMIP